MSCGPFPQWGQAVGMDQTVGFGLVTFAASVFVYYTVWVIILPFVEPSQSIHALFLPRIYAIAVPLIAGVIALSLIVVFVLYMTMKPKKTKSS